MQCAPNFQFFDPATLHKPSGYSSDRYSLHVTGSPGNVVTFCFAKQVPCQISLVASLFTTMSCPESGEL